MNKIRPAPDDDDRTIRQVLMQRTHIKDYPLTAEDVRLYSNFLINLIREKIEVLAGDGDLHLSTVEALNHVMMSPRWLNRTPLEQNAEPLPGPISEAALSGEKKSE